MSFKQSYSDVTICNLALSRIKQSPINNLEPPQPAGTAAQACARWYKPVVAKLLETHHWGLASKRVTLTETTNDRLTDGWQVAYQKPDDMAFPVRLVGYGQTPSAMQYYPGLGGIIAMLNGQSVFLVAGDRIYTRGGGAEIDYVSYELTEADFNSTFVDILVKSLASQLAFPITGNYKMGDALNEEAINAMNVAIAQNLNAGQPRYGEFISQTDRARGDGSPLPWDWNYLVYPL